MPLFEVVSVALSVLPFMVYPLGAMCPIKVSRGYYLTMLLVPSGV